VSGSSFQAGYSPSFLIQLKQVQCKISKLKAKIDKRTGKVIEEGPQSVKTGDACLVEVIPNEPVQVEVFSQMP
jgi:elongation factor 1-alpha